MKNVEFIESLAEKTFDTLDKLCILPLSIFKSPTEYERYPRLLSEFLLRRKEVKLAFKEWETKVLRDSKVSKDTALSVLKDYEKFLFNNSQKVMENFDSFSRTSYSWALEYISERKIVGEEFRKAGDIPKKNVTEVCQKLSTDEAIKEVRKIIKDIIPKGLSEDKVSENIRFLIRHLSYFAKKEEEKK